MLTITHEYKLQPTIEQIATIEQTLDVCRSVWNFALRQRKDWCSSRKSPVNACSIQSEYIISADEPFPNYHLSAKQLTEAKNQYPQLKTVHSQVLQQVRGCVLDEMCTLHLWIKMAQARLALAVAHIRGKRP